MHISSVWAEICLRISEGTDQHGKSLHLCVNLERCPSVSLACLDMPHLTVLVQFPTDSLQMEERLRETEYLTFNYLYTHTHTHLHARTNTLHRCADRHTHSFRERVTQSKLFDLIGASLTSFKDQSQCSC